MQRYEEIVPEELANPLSYPYVVKLFIHFPSREKAEICTGALITRSLVITAGHCVSTDYEVAASLEVQFPPGVLRGRYSVRKVFGIIRTFPPDDDFTGEEQVDIAILELAVEINICNRTCIHYPYIPILRLPIRNIYNITWQPLNLGPKIYTNCTLLGYGKTASGVHNLRQISNMALWHLNHRFLVPLLSAESQGRTCYGDSGGPTVCYSRNGTPILYGITSFSIGQLDLQSRKLRCYDEDSTYLVDVLTDVQYILPRLREILIREGKLDEFLYDNKKSKAMDTVNALGLLLADNVTLPLVNMKTIYPRI
uniref:Peptidase S1 domain-containing protein n=1 Tax=Syphacia muris TaxID=451379 RepID=A0A158R5T4_9BILA